MATWYETDYYPTFHCKCGACRHTCCRGWQIDVTEEEYFRLIGMDCSEKLHQKLECAFAAPELSTPEAYRVLSPNWRGDCHLLDGDGLCMLQKECGENQLPKICRFYPRSLRREGALQQACCSGSCEAVVEILLREEKLGLIRREENQEPLLAEEIPSDGRLLSRRCFHLLQDRSLPLPQRIGRICTAIGCDRVIGKEELDKAIEELLSVAPNMTPYLERKNEAAPETERHKENLLANHLIYEDFPFVDQRLEARDAGYGLMLAYELLCRVDGHEGDELADAYAEAFRLMEHTAFYYNAAVLLRKEEATDE